ncbi:MAG TPA: hypothetical protein VGV38_01335, partial [Pyrinomonadaceae bacterium]|nr:hypothetical protein [Pyrinomonadaceae bacterium]
MSEIARRMKRMPLSLWAALLLGALLAAGSLVTVRSRAAGIFVPAGDDRFETTDNGETYHNFSGKPVPAGFFNTDGQSTSYAYSGTVPLKGSPLPGEGNVDTIISREQGVWTTGTTTLRITGLSLVSINPITVSYSDRPSESWSVRVGLSDYTASTGSMTIRDGGTFDSSLSVFPKFTFTRVSDGAVKVLDTGAAGYAAAAADGPDGSAAIARCQVTDVEPTTLDARAASDSTNEAAAA